MNKNNTSGFRGVSFEKAANKFRAYITFNKEKKRLGYFPTAEEAYSARCKAEELLRGENFSIPNYCFQLLNPNENIIQYPKDVINNAWINSAVSYLLNNKPNNESFLNFSINYIMSKTHLKEPPKLDINKGISCSDFGFNEWLKGVKSMRQLAVDFSVPISSLRLNFTKIISILLEQKGPNIV